MNYVKLYSGADPIFDEEDVFRLTVPLNADYSPEKSGSRINEPLNEPLNDKVLRIIAAEPGITRPTLIVKTGKGRATITRILSLLVKNGKIEHRGSDKTGGYYAI